MKWWDNWRDRSSFKYNNHRPGYKQTDWSDQEEGNSPSGVNEMQQYADYTGLLETKHTSD